MSEYNITDKELLELVKPIQKWLLENYDPMCKIIVRLDGVEVVRNELFISNNDRIDELGIEITSDSSTVISLDKGEML